MSKYEFYCVRDIRENKTMVLKPAFAVLYDTLSFEGAFRDETEIVEYYLRRFPWNDPLSWVLE